MTQYPPPPAYPQHPSAGAVAAPRTSGLAIASLVCGIVGFCTLGLAGLVGAILGILALVSISKSQGAVGGNGFAIAGIIVGVLSIPISCLPVGILLPALGKAREAAREVMLENNLRQLGTAMELFRYDTGRFPSANNWLAELQTMYPPEDDIEMLTMSPFGTENTRVMAMNAQLSEVEWEEITDAAATVMVFECAPGSPLAGGPELMPAEPARRRGYAIIFADNHYEFVSPDRVGSLRWSP